jgi:hypothetical protein
MLRSQAGAIGVLSCWIGLNLFVWFAATRTFRTIEQILKSPDPRFSRTVELLGAEPTRDVLRHVASEINRRYFRAYGWTEILLGIILLVLLYRQTPRDTVGVAMVGGMLVLVVALTLVITPRISSLGRKLDFTPHTPPPPEMRRFWMLHGAFTSLDGVKLLAGIILLIRWIAHI